MQSTHDMHGAERAHCRRQRRENRRKVRAHAKATGRTVVSVGRVQMPSGRWYAMVFAP